MSSDLKICMAPMNIIWDNKEANVQTFRSLIEKVHPETDLLILPETFSTGFRAGKDKEEVRALAERNTGATIDLIKDLAAKHHLAICGSFVADSGGSLYNRAFFIEPSGDETFADKRHLFTMAGEDKVFSRGYSRLKVRYRGWNIAMVICYDVRFPVWCRNRLNEYDLLVAVANWPDVRVEAWKQLLPARAIENEAYVCGVNCKGTDPGEFNYDGASMAIDFKGRDITVRNSGNENSESDLLYALLSRDRLERFRTKFPAWADADNFRLL